MSKLITTSFFFFISLYGLAQNDFDPELRQVVPVSSGNAPDKEFAKYIKDLSKEEGEDLNYWIESTFQNNTRIDSSLKYKILLKLVEKEGLYFFQKGDDILSKSIIESTDVFININSKSVNYSTPTHEEIEDCFHSSFFDLESRILKENLYFNESILEKRSSDKSDHPKRRYKKSDILIFFDTVTQEYMPENLESELEKMSALQDDEYRLRSKFHLAHELLVNKCYGGFPFVVEDFMYDAMEANSLGRTIQVKWLVGAIKLFATYNQKNLNDHKIIYGLNSCYNLMSGVNKHSNKDSQLIFKLMYFEYQFWSSKPGFDASYKALSLINGIKKHRSTFSLIKNLKYALHSNKSYMENYRFRSLRGTKIQDKRWLILALNIYIDDYILSKLPSDQFDAELLQLNQKIIADFLEYSPLENKEKSLLLHIKRFQDIKRSMRRPVSRSLITRSALDISRLLYRTNKNKEYKDWINLSLHSSRVPKLFHKKYQHDLEKQIQWVFTKNENEIYKYFGNHVYLDSLFIVPDQSKVAFHLNLIVRKKLIKAANKFYLLKQVDKAYSMLEFANSMPLENDYVLGRSLYEDAVLLSNLDSTVIKARDFNSKNTKMTTYIILAIVIGLFLLILAVTVSIASHRNSLINIKLRLSKNKEEALKFAISEVGHMGSNALGHMIARLKNVSALASDEQNKLNQEHQNLNRLKKVLRGYTDNVSEELNSLTNEIAHGLELSSISFNVPKVELEKHVSYKNKQSLKVPRYSVSNLVYNSFQYGEIHNSDAKITINVQDANRDFFTVLFTDNGKSKNQESNIPIKKGGTKYSQQMLEHLNERIPTNFKHEIKNGIGYIASFNVAKK